VTSNVQVVKLDGKGKRSKAASKAARWIGEDGQEIGEDREGEFVEGLEGRGGWWGVGGGGGGGRREGRRRNW